jgi:ribonuclease HI
MKVFECYTDGGSKIHKEIYEASSGILVYHGGTCVAKKGKFHKGGTNNYGEAYAVLYALKNISKYIRKNNIKGPYAVHIYMDSKLTRDACESWIYNWAKAKGKIWLNSEKKPVANQSVFKKIYKQYLLNENFKITFLHIKSHIVDEFPPPYKIDAKYIDKVMKTSKAKSALEKFCRFNKLKIDKNTFFKHIYCNHIVDEICTEVMQREGTL